MEDSTPNAPLPQLPAPSLSPLLVAVLAATIGLALFLTAGGFTQLINPAFGVWFTEIFVFFGLSWVLLRSAHYDPVTYTGLRFPGWGPTAFGFALGVVNFFAIVVPIQYTAQWLAPEWLREMFDGSQIFRGQTPVELAAIIAGVAIAAPVCEEVFFRGLLQKGLLPPTLSRAGAVAVTAVVFSTFHLDPVGFFARAELGVLFGVLRLYTGSLWPSILAHSANNVVSTVLFLVAQQSGVEATDAEAPLEAIFLLAAMGATGLGGLLWIARQFPWLWGPRQEEPTLTRPSPSLARLLLPWVVGATLALGGLALVDTRGIRLRMFDTQHRLPPLSENAPNALHAERAHLERLREGARRGRIPMEVYQEERIRQAREHRRPER